MAENTAHSTPSVPTCEAEPSGQGHRTRNTTNEAGTPVNRSQPAKDTAQTAYWACTLMNMSQVAKDTAHPAPHTERAHP